MGREALKKYAVNLADDIVELSWSLYDFTTYNSAGQTVLSFFQNPIGSTGKTLVDTNMDLAGQIPKGQQFLVENICAEFTPGDAIEGGSLTAYNDDVKVVANNGALKFSIGSTLLKNEAPLGSFPQQYRQVGYAATGLAAGHVAYSVNVGMIHSIVPVLITSNQNFLVSFNWPTAVALPSGTDGRIGVRLGGRLFRNAQ